MANGSRHSLYAVKETVIGTTPTNPALSLVRIKGTTLGLSKDPLESEEIRSDGMIADFRLGANQVNGDINFEMSYGTFDELLQATIRSVAWAGTPEAIKGGITPSSFTMVRHFADLAAENWYIYRGVEVASASFSIAANAMVEGTFTVFGQSQTIASDLSALGTPTFPAATTTSPMDSFTGALKEGGVTIGVVTAMSLNITQNIAARFVVGSKNSIDPSRGRNNLTGTLTVFFEDSTMVNKFLNETPSSLEFDMPDRDGNKVTFTIPRVIYTGGKPDVSGEGPITLEMPFQAILDPTENTNIIITRTPKP